MKITLLNARRVKGKLGFALKVAVIALIVAVVAELFALYPSHLEAVSASPDAHGRVYVIDAGHGGEDSGAVGKSGILEKDLNLQIATLIADELLAKGKTVIMTRTDDRLLYREDQNIKGIRKISDLKNRCEIANSYTDAVLISVHMNSFGDAKYHGLQVYSKPSDSDSRALAEAIQSSVKMQLQKDNGRIPKEGKNLYLLKNSIGTAVIVECGFISNIEECEKLSEKEYQKKLSFAIVCGIIEYEEQINKSQR